MSFSCEKENTCYFEKTFWQARVYRSNNQFQRYLGLLRKPNLNWIINYAMRDVSLSFAAIEVAVNKKKG